MGWKKVFKTVGTALRLRDYEALEKLKELQSRQNVDGMRW